MAKKFDLSQFQERAGTLYRYDGQVWNKATGSEVRWYSKNKTGGSSSLKAPKFERPIRDVPKNYKNLFQKKAPLKNGQGVLRGWARPLTLRGGADPDYGFRRLTYYKPGVLVNGKRKIEFSPHTRYGTDLNQLNKKDIGKTKIGKGYVIKGSHGWIEHLKIAIRQVTLNAEHFRIAVGYRAMKVFQDSFKRQQFHSAGTTKWAPLSKFTLKKRKKRNIKSKKILHEYGDLRNSIEMNENYTGNTTSGKITRIYTKQVEANADHYKKRTLCYAGLHNSPQPGETYGRWGNPPKPYIQRQFMGHSTYIEAFALSKMKTYLFDDVFLVREV